MNPLIQGPSGITPEMSRNAFSTNQGTNEDDYQSDPHPEAGIFGNQMTQNSGPEDDRDRNNWVEQHFKKKKKKKVININRNQFVWSQVSLYVGADENTPHLLTELESNNETNNQF